MEKLTVNRDKPFSFSKEIEKDYGLFKIRQQNEIAARVLEFTINDLMFFDAPCDEMIRASDFADMVVSAGYVPLDLYCAKTILKNKDAMWGIYSLWHETEIDADNCHLDSIMFLGNIVARNETDVDHFATFNYPFGFDMDTVKLTPYEDELCFVKNRDFILVFKKEFIKNF